MKEKELQLVTFEQAKKLSNVGFDGKTNYYFRPYNSIPFYSTSRYNFNECNDDINVGSYQCSAPTVALALKWIRDEKEIKSEIRFYYQNSNYQDCYYQGFIDISNHKYLDYTNHFDTYEEAESALLDELLTILEKIIEFNPLKEEKNSNENN
jgi:hypothetical protein